MTVKKNPRKEQVQTVSHLFIFRFIRFFVCLCFYIILSLALSYHTAVPVVDADPFPILYFVSVTHFPSFPSSPSLPLPFHLFTLISGAFSAYFTFKWRSIFFCSRFFSSSFASHACQHFSTLFYTARSLTHSNLFLRALSPFLSCFSVLVYFCYRTRQKEQGIIFTLYFFAFDSCVRGVRRCALRNLFLSLVGLYYLLSEFYYFTHWRFWNPYLLTYDFLIFVCLFGRYGDSIQSYCVPTTVSAIIF